MGGCVLSLRLCPPSWEAQINKHRRDSFLNCSGYSRQHCWERKLCLQGKWLQFVQMHCRDLHVLGALSPDFLTVANQRTLLMSSPVLLCPVPQVVCKCNVRNSHTGLLSKCRFLAWGSEIITGSCRGKAYESVFILVSSHFDAGPLCTTLLETSPRVRYMYACAYVKCILFVFVFME